MECQYRELLEAGLAERIVTDPSTALENPERRNP